MTQEPNSASVALIEGDKVLLIQRARAPYQYLWTLPGGTRDEGESIEQCVVREVREELGLDVSEVRLVEVQSFGAWKLAVFASRNFGGTIMADESEIRDWRWVKLTEVVGLRTTSHLDLVSQRAFALFA